MQPGFRIAGVFGPGLLVVDDRSGFAAGIPRAHQLPIAAVRRELPLDIWFRIDGLPIKLGFRWFPTNTAGAPNELVQDVANEVWITRSPFASPDVDHAMPDQRARWNVEAAASVMFPAPGPPKAPGMPAISPVDRDGFHAEEAIVLYRRDRGIVIAYKRFDPAIPRWDWAMFQSFVNGSMRWNPVSYQLAPPPQLRSSFVRPGIGIALLPEREAELPALSALLRRELPPGDDRLEKLMWGMLTGSEPLDAPVPLAELMDRAFANMIRSDAVVRQLRAHYAQLQITLDLKGMATMYLRALGKTA